MQASRYAVESTLCSTYADPLHESRQQTRIPPTADCLIYPEKVVAPLVLEPIYEEEFADLWSDDFSYGFRLGKSAHQALDRIRNESMNIKGDELSGYSRFVETVRKYRDTSSDKELAFKKAIDD